MAFTGKETIVAFGRRQPPMRAPRLLDRATECEHCGEPAQTEYHHWAPKHLFEDAERWPGSYLCRSCHMEWHRIVTPNMNRRAG